MFKLSEIKGGYSYRTRLNCNSATVTIAVAVDFSTAGERLTKTASKGRYVALPYEKCKKLSFIKSLYEKINIAPPSLFTESQGLSIHMAGNGVYTFTKHGILQKEVDSKIYALLKHLHKKFGIVKIYSGGQTGVDLAGCRAALRLAIPLEVNMPENYKIRDSEGVDHYQNYVQALHYILDK